MLSRRFLFFASMSLVLVSAIPGHSFASDTDPRAFVTNVGNQVLQLLDERQSPAADREKQFGTLVTATFDIPRIAQFVLGQNWRSTTDDERLQFAQVFQTYLIQSYWSLFGQYNGQSFSVTREQPQSANLTLVTMEITQPAGKPTVEVDWMVAKEGDTLKAIDVSIGGVSQVLTYRDEFASFLGRNGGSVSGLIADLKQKMEG